MWRGAFGIAWNLYFSLGSFYFLSCIVVMNNHCTFFRQEMLSLFFCRESWDDHRCRQSHAPYPRSVGHTEPTHCSLWSVRTLYGHTSQWSPVCSQRGDANSELRNWWARSSKDCCLGDDAAPVNKSDLSKKILYQTAFFCYFTLVNTCDLAYWITQTSLIMWNCDVLRKM